MLLHSLYSNGRNEEYIYKYNYSLTLFISQNCNGSSRVRRAVINTKVTSMYPASQLTYYYVYMYIHKHGIEMEASLDIDMQLPLATRRSNNTQRTVWSFVSVLLCMSNTVAATTTRIRPCCDRVSRTGNELSISLCAWPERAGWGAETFFRRQCSRRNLSWHVY